MASPLASPTAASTPRAKRLGKAVKYGETDPISCELPADEDEQRTQRLLQELGVVFPAETPEEMAAKQEALRQVQSLFSEWADCLVKVTPVGSFRLGVSTSSSDVDVLCAAPPGINRQDFFTVFAEKLTDHEGVSECVPIPTAFTPVIKIKMNSIEMDLLFAQLTRPLEEDDDLAEVLKDDAMLVGMAEQCVRSVNALRVATKILELVPNQTTFQQTLRFIKHWARRRGLYCNSLGFLGGISWSILVARVCQLYPYFAPSQLVLRFFRLYQQWNWEKVVTLCEVIDPKTINGLEHLSAWDADQTYAVMPVLTPAVPAMNSTHNTTDTSKRILLEEFARGYKLLQKGESERIWEELADEFPFFTSCDAYVQVVVLGTTVDSFAKVAGLFESKLRLLVMNLEPIPGMLLHPSHQRHSVGTQLPEDYSFGCAFYIGLKFTTQVARPHQYFDLNGAVQAFVQPLLRKLLESGTEPGTFMVKVKRVNAPQLQEQDGSVSPPEAQETRSASASVRRTRSTEDPDLLAKPEAQAAKRARTA
mmetsp:Transcript_45099/g.107216  ORF Transcript_45099/g.107216 Transcript_45099/m.107216 type:complete len:534 (+) Transcript_45099:63-1664(+)